MFCAGDVVRDNVLCNIPSCLGNIPNLNLNLNRASREAESFGLGGSQSVGEIISKLICVDKINLLGRATIL